MSDSAVIDASRDATAAWAAMSRGDYGEAAAIGVELRASDPDNREGYHIGSMAARNMGRFDEAAEILARAAARFPDEAWLLAEAGWAAFTQGRGVDALDRAVELRRRFPDDPAGYQIGCAAGRRIGWLFEAGEVASAARMRFPLAAWPLEEAGWTALERRDASLAATLGAELCARFPDNANGYWIGLSGARMLGRVTEANTFLAEGKRRFPTLDWPADVNIGVGGAASLVELRPDKVVAARLLANRTELIRALGVAQGATIVEVGVGNGDFSETLVDAIAPAKFIAIDAFAASAGAVGRAEAYARRLARLGPRLEIKPGDPSESLEALQDGGCDLIYLAREFSHERLTRRAEIALRKLKPSGAIVFNGYTLCDQHLGIPGGVVSAVNGLVNRETLNVVGFALDRNMFCDIAIRRG